MHNFIKRCFALIALTSALTAMVGCDSHNDNKTSSSSAGSSSSIAPIDYGNVQVQFPPLASQTAAAEITIRGIVAEPSLVNSLSIDGNPVLSIDDLSHWHYDVALLPGKNELAFEIQYSDNSIEQKTIVIDRKPLLISPNDFVLDAQNGRFLLLDRSQNSIVAMTITGEVISAFSPTTAPINVLPTSAPAESETDNLINYPSGIVLDQDRNRAIVYQQGIKQLIAIDLTTGAQSILPITLPADHDILQIPRNAVIDNDQLYVADVEAVYFIDGERVEIGTEDSIKKIYDIIYTIDLNNNEIAIVSAYDAEAEDTTTHTSPLLAMTSTPSSELIYALQQTSTNYRLVTIDKTTAERTVKTISNSDSTASALSTPKAMTLDSTLGKLLLLVDNSVYTLDITTGIYTILSSKSVPAEEDVKIRQIEKLAFDRVNNILYFLDSSFDHIGVIDTESGDRSLLANTNVTNENLKLRNAGDITIDPAKNRVYVLDNLQGAILQVDLTTGTHSRAFEQPTAAGVTSAIVYPIAATLGAEGKLLVLDNYNQYTGTFYSEKSPRIVQVDPANQTATMAYNKATTSTVLYDDIVYDGESGWYYIAQGNRIIKYSLNMDPNANLNTFSGGLKPSDHYMFRDLKAIALDKPRNRLLAVDATLNAVLSVDLTTGERTAFSSFDPSEDDSVINFAVPKAIVVDSKNNRALVLDAAINSIIAVDLESGEKSSLVDFSSSLATGMINPVDMDIHPDFGYLVITDSISMTVLALDLETRQVVTLGQ